MFSLFRFTSLTPFKFLEDRRERRTVEAERAAAQQRRAAAAVVLQRTARGKRGRRAVAARVQAQHEQRIVYEQIEREMEIERRRLVTLRHDSLNSVLK